MIFKNVVHYTFSATVVFGITGTLVIKLTTACVKYNFQNHFAFVLVHFEGIKNNLPCVDLKKIAIPICQILSFFLIMNDVGNDVLKSDL